MEPQQQEADGNAVGKKFGYMIQAIQGALPDDSLKQFAKLKTDLERFSFAWNRKELHDVITLEKEFSEKSAKIARRHREKGNEYFLKKSYLSALSEYNQSVLAAPLKDQEVKTGSSNGEKEEKENEQKKNKAEGQIIEEVEEEGKKEAEKVVDVEEEKNELALAFANRSATLLHLKKYKRCLEDVHLAMEHGYPPEMHYKMSERKARCHQELGNPSLAISIFHEAKKLIPLANLKEKAVKTLTESLDKQIEACRSHSAEKPSQDVEGIKERRLQAPELSGGCHQKYPRMSSKLRVHQTPSLGKHLIAENDITTGEVVMVEEPYLSVVYPEFYLSHCYHCFVPIDVPIPCTQCKSIAYCSRDCRETSWVRFHRHECCFFALIDRNMCGRIGHLAFRLAMMMGPDWLAAFATQHQEKLMEQEKEKAVYEGDYDCVHELINNSTERKAEDAFHLAIVACLLVKLLQLTGFPFDALAGSPDFDAFGGVMLRHLQIIQCNAWGIVELQQPEKFDDLKPEELGIGLYPTAALVNHSCDPSADLNFFDDTLVLRAIRGIRKGEEVSVSYGPLFLDVKQVQRQSLLKKSHLFNCRCAACVEHWPVVREMFEAPGYACSQCGAPLDTYERIEHKYYKCSKCEHKQDMEELIGCLETSYDSFADAMSDALGGRAQDCLPRFLQHQQLLQKYIRHPWRDLAACQTVVKNAYRLKGNVKVA